VQAKIFISTTGVFSGPRLAWPIDYANGAAALLWLPLPALIAGASAERLRPLARGAIGGAAALAAAEGLMTLSRGAAIALAAAILVTAVASLDHVPRLDARRFPAPAAAVVWTCIAVVAIAAFAVRYGRPDTWLEHRWHEFRNVQTVQPGNAARFGTAASNR